MDTSAKGSDSRHRSALRSGLLLGVVLVLLVLLVLLVGPLSFPTGSLRTRAEETAREALGRDVTIGDLDFRLLPTPTMTMREVRVAASKEAEIETLAKSAILSARIAPLPLLRRRIQLSRVMIEDGTISLERLPDGSFAAVELIDALQREPRPGWELKVDRVAFKEVDIDIIDRHVVLGRSTVTRGRDASGEMLVGSIERGIPVELQMALFDHPTRNVEIRGVLPRGPPREREAGDGRSLTDPARPLDLEVRLTRVETAPLEPYLGELSQYMPSTLSLQGSVAGDLAATVNVEGTLEITPQMVVSLTGLVDFSEEPPRAAIEGSIPPMATGHLIASMPFLDEALPPPVHTEGRVRISGQARGPLDDLRLAGWLQSPGFRVAAGTFLGGRAGGGGFLIDSRDMIATLDVRRRDDAAPRLNLDLRSSSTIVDYETGEEARKEPPGLPALLVNARVRVDEGRFSKLELQDLDLHLRMEQRRLTLRPWLQAYGGSMRARLDSDLNRTPAYHRLELEVIEVDAGALARGLLPDPDPPVTGDLTAELLVGWRGLDFDAFRESALGEGSLVLERGRIAGLDLEPDIAEALRQVAETVGVLPPQEFTEPTLRTARGTFSIANGFLTTEVMEVRGSEVRILVGGGVGMDRALALSGSFAFSPEAAARFGPVSQLLRGPDGWLSVPFSVNGRVEEPDIYIDAPALLRRAAAGVITTPDERWEELRRLWREHWAPPLSPSG